MFFLTQAMTIAILALKIVLCSLSIAIAIRRLRHKML